MLRTLQEVIIFEIEIWEPVKPVCLVTTILAAHLFIIILHVFYFFRFVVYLVVFDVQQ